MIESSLFIRRKLLVLLLSFFAFIVLRMPIVANADDQADKSDKYRVTIYYDVDNDHDGEDNYFRLYYWMPAEAGYQYSDDSILFEKVAKKSGSRTVSAELPGPPESLLVSIHGSMTDNVKLYVKKVEVETLDPVSGCGLPKKVTLWEGVFGCSVATFASNTIYNRLYFNNPSGGSFPYFQGWKDPGTEWDAKFGDEKETVTSDFYKEGCKNPATIGRAGFGVNFPDSLPIPQDSRPAYYSFKVTDGVLYDCFGAKWPVQSMDSSLSFSPTNKNLQIELGADGTLNLYLNPNSNAEDDYTLTVTHTKAGTNESAKVTLQSFDYNYTFLDDYGSVVGKSTVNYGASVNPPYDGVNTVAWYCDAYSDWQNTKDGPQNRTVYRNLLEGSGTKEKPTLIKTSDDWDKLSTMTVNGTAKGKYFRLENNITVTKLLGTSKNPFEGTFDGNGKILTVHYNNLNNDERTAPFSYAKNAVISNLTVIGSIDGSADHAAGLLGENDGTTLIKNCTVSATIKGGKYVGGLSIGSGGNLSIEDSVFEGMLNGTTDCGGFVAWGTKSLVLRNCKFAPLAGSAIESGATFVNREFKKIIDCVYYTALGTPQGLSYDRSTADPSLNGDKKQGSSEEQPVLATRFVAGNKAFKAKTKTKKYTVTLKDQNNKAVKNVKLLLKVNGKTYSAKTKANGKATFLINKLKKKGKYKATISFAGNKSYKLSKKKVIISVK